MYVVVIVLRAMMLFFPSSDDDAGVELPFSLPSWQTVYSFFQAVPRYIQLLLQTIGGSNVRLDLRALMLQAQQQDASRQTQYVHTHQDYDHVFSPWMTYLPILNLIYIPRLFTRKDNIYYLAI